MDAKGNQAAYPLHPNQNFASTGLTKRDLIRSAVQARAERQVADENDRRMAA